jgi:hypothetical protein
MNADDFGLPGGAPAASPICRNEASADSTNDRTIVVERECSIV